MPKQLFVFYLRPLANMSSQKYRSTSPVDSKPFSIWTTAQTVHKWGSPEATLYASRKKSSAIPSDARDGGTDYTSSVSNAAGDGDSGSDDPFHTAQNSDSYWASVQDYSKSDIGEQV